MKTKSRSMFPGIGLTIVTLLLAVSSQAQVLTLDSVLAIIDRKHPMLQEYDQKGKALDQYAAGANSWMAPMVGAGTFMMPYDTDKALHENEKGAWMFSVEQEIPNPAKLNASRNYLQSRSDVERENRAAQFNNLRSEARTHYYKWLIAEKKIAALGKNAEAMEVMLAIAKARYAYNQGSLGNIYLAEARISEVQNEILMSRSVIDNSSNKLKSLLTLSPTDSLAIDTTMVVDFGAQRLLPDTAVLGIARSDTRRIDETIEAMRLNQQLQLHQRKPDFKVRLDHMQPVGDMPRQFSAMAMVSIPIVPWSSKMYKAEIKGMDYEIEAMKKNREAILLETRGMLAGMQNDIRRMEQQLSNYRTKIIPALRNNYETLIVAYEENREQLPMVIDGWEALNMAQLAYLDTMEKYYLMIVAYDKEMEQ